MKQIVVVLLLIMICCSACSQPSAQIDSSNYASEIVSPPSLPDNDELSSASKPEETSVATDSSSSTNEVVSPPGLPDNDEHSSASEQGETSLAADVPDYQGLTQEQWNELQEQKEEYGHLSAKERGMAQFNGEIECPEFKHLRWEHLIAGALIYHVGVDEFEAWLKEIDSINNDDQCDIYNFAKYFSIELDELVSLIEKENLVEVYDLDTVKRRYEYFVKDLQE